MLHVCPPPPIPHTYPRTHTRTHTHTQTRARTHLHHVAQPRASRARRASSTAQPCALPNRPRCLCHCRCVRRGVRCAERVPARSPLPAARCKGRWRSTHGHAPIKKPAACCPQPSMRAGGATHIGVPASNELLTHPPSDPLWWAGCVACGVRRAACAMPCAVQAEVRGLPQLLLLHQEVPEEALGRGQAQARVQGLPEREGPHRVSAECRTAQHLAWPPPRPGATVLVFRPGPPCLELPACTHTPRHTQLHAYRA